MSVELRPLGVTCNIQCQYCYQQPQRDASEQPRYDLALMKQAILSEGGPFTLFGGEPLLLPLSDLEDLWEWGLRSFGHNSVQTNGTLIQAEHLRLFSKYRVSVGISMDGPADLNDIRWHGTLERTRESTAQTQRAIELLCEGGSPPSLIITLHRGNAQSDRIEKLLSWIVKLGTLGVRQIRLHLLELEDPALRATYALTEAENTNAMLRFLQLHKEHPELSFDTFPEMRRLLLGDDRVTTCVWYACDPYTTRAVRGVEGHGQRSNCGRTNKDGVDFIKASTRGFERYLALHQSPQGSHGCSGCRFFLMCKGQCPGTAEDGDWRNRTEHCGTWKTLFSTLEASLIAEGSLPLSLSSNREEVERQAIARWETGQEVSVFAILQSKADRAQQELTT